MKNLKLIGFLMLMVSSLMFIQCTTDTIEGQAGADGLNGVDGVDGVDGLNGLNGTDGLDGADIAVCISCHSNEHTDPIEAAWLNSGHFQGTHTGGYYGSRESCAQCHSNEGYVDLLTKGFVKPGGYYGNIGAIYEIDDNDTPDDTSDDFVVIEDDEDEPTFGLPVITNDFQSNASKISCNTCHSDHSSFDFANDGNDKALRKGWDAVTLIIDGVTSIDRGLNNTCIQCHQPRGSYAIPNDVDDYAVTSSRFGPHHGPQSTVVEGLMGAESATGSYPAPGSSKHAEASCITCHMGDPTNPGTDGSHTWWPTDNACLSCHATVPTEVAGFATSLATLKAELVALGALTDSGSTVRGTWPAPVAQAMWNYKTLTEDLSEGVHNPAYARALLQSSLDGL